MGEVGGGPRGMREFLGVMSMLIVIFFTDVYVCHTNVK